MNRRNNDRLTSFMLAMQSDGGPMMMLVGRTSSPAWPGWAEEEGSRRTSTQQPNAQEKMRRLMDLPATDDLEWTRHDR